MVFTRCSNHSPQEILLQQILQRQDRCNGGMSSKVTYSSNVSKCSILATVQFHERSMPIELAKNIKLDYKFVNKLCKICKKVRVLFPAYDCRGELCFMVYALSVWSSVYVSLNHVLLECAVILTRHMLTRTCITIYFIENAFSAHLYFDKYDAI